MSDPWDEMIASDDAELVAEIAADAKSYVQALAAGDDRGCLAIEQKYDLVGLTPEQVSQHLADMALQGGAS
jgi:hypothetical protein